MNTSNAARLSRPPDRFRKEMMESAEKTRKDIEKLVQEQVQTAVGKLHLATQKIAQNRKEARPAPQKGEVSLE